MEFDVVITPSFAQAETWRKRYADEREGGLFAQAVGPFAAWIADLWELQGDGRLIADDVQRAVLARRAAVECGGAVQLAPVAAACMREAAGLPQFERVLEDAREGRAVEGLSQRECAFAALMARYEDLLAKSGLIEAGQAAALLAGQASRVFPRPLRVLVSGGVPLTAIQRQFFDACEALEVIDEASGQTEMLGQAPSGVQVQFAFPTGALAQPGLVADVICDAKGANAVVTCTDSLALFEQVEGRLAKAGFSVRVRGSRPFPQTAFGRAYLALYRCLHDEPWDPAALSDVLYSPFSGLSRADASRFDAAMRADRILRREAALTQLRASQELFSQLEELASDPDADVLAGVFENLVQGMTQRGEAWRAEQLGALSALRSVAGVVRAAGLGIDACAAVLERVSVPVSAQVGTGERTVLITTQAIAAQLPPRSCDVLVAADLTSESYPAADKDDAAATFLGVVDVAPGESALGRARRQFRALLELATDRIVLVRPLGDANADETYPSVVLEEFIDAYRADPSATEDVDNRYRLPQLLQDGLVERGEERLFANAVAARPYQAQPVGAVVATPHLDDLPSDAAADVMPQRRDSQGVAIARPCPSPSQIETYLECPYRWFAARRLRVDELDEGFGPLERGTFAHAALERFYRSFQATGELKVNEANLDDARALMRSVTRELAQEQADLEPRSGRLVAAAELERREVAALCEQLVAYLDFEAKLLPTFHPAYFEYEIGADQAIEYAGYPLVGTVDRIDVDERGHAAIVDYKGSVNDEHAIAGKREGHAGKVQTRIYAQAIKRALGLDVVAALYVSYGRRPAVSGSYDPRVIETAHLPGVKADVCSCGTLERWPDPVPDECSLADLTFDCMLDETETIAGRAIDAMAQGDIAPRPASAHVCDFCPVLACPKRGA